MDYDKRTQELRDLRQEIERNPLHTELTEPRLERMLQVAGSRLSSITVVLENLWDTHNVSAVVRSAETLGLDQVHVVEDPRPYRRHPAILHGADRWLEIVRHPDIATCLAHLAQRGFLTCAADVGEDCTPLGELPADSPLAVVFGSEKTGLSPLAKIHTDLRYRVPMHGFTESFNVSVSAAISLWDLTNRRRRVLGAAGDMSVPEMVTTVNGWLGETRGRRTPT